MGTHRVIMLSIVAAALCLAVEASAAESIFNKVFDGTNRWDEVLYDRNIDVDTSPGSARLLKTEIIADEMGNITDATMEQLTGSLRAKKELVIADPAADKATLLVYTSMPQDGKFILEVNGTANTITFDTDRRLTGGWNRVDVDPKQLKKGLNTFVIYPAPGNTLTLFIDNCRYPNRSARSLDAGATWDYDHLGIQGFCDGEYLIRLRLGHYPAQGEILSDFIDAGDLVTAEPVKPIFDLKEIKLAADVATPKGTAVSLFLRGGSTPAYEPAAWDSWRPAAEYANLSIAGRKWKFFQWKAVLSTTGGLATPSLSKVTVTVKADVAPAAGKKAQADVSKNRRIIRGYYNYAYQPMEDARLRYLREHYRLDEVVGVCSSEFEKFEVLATWLRGQWRDGWGAERNGTLRTPWDAEVILEMVPDFKASGMCTIYSNAFVQCALAVGLNVRGVVLDHHFISEIWSNEYEKWVMFDIGFNNLSIRTSHTELNGIPLSAVEILKAVNEGKQADLDLVPPRLWKSRWKGNQAAEAKIMDPIQWKARVGIMTRNNFLQTWLPGELQHGFMQYTYDGYLWWKKTLIPEYEEYTFQTSHYRDMYWTLNQVQVFLSETGKPGELKVQFDTVTPNLDRMLVRLDGGEWKPVTGDMAWVLKTGTNRLEVKPINTWGHDGITSEVVVRY